MYHLSPIIATLYAILSKYETFQTKNYINKWEKEMLEFEKQRKERSVSNRISKTAKDIFNEDLAELVRLDQQAVEEA